ncbi:helix-turn-helix domain-containing protein [Pimelobacter simplex]|uniref:helix-turn-helix domain-containing protein n=1 Tax=Nocardioides simplex TaxID=2045 RepID=UPI00193389F0|nr:helix-turn-helix domain-containing protein [Pimelobacter simplex]
MTTYLTPEQAAERLPFGNADWIRMQLRAGRLRGSRIGGRWLIEPAAIEEMVAAGSNRQGRRRRRRRSGD